MPVFQLTYVSKANGLIDDTELGKILNVSRTKNTTKKITGILLFREQMFFQILEGDKDVVEATSEIIRQDKRHTNFTRLVQEYKPTRLFPEWAMAYNDSLNNADEVVDFFKDYQNMIFDTEQKKHRERRSLLMDF